MSPRSTTIDSVHRYPCIPGRTGEDVALQYWTWLDGAWGALVGAFLGPAGVLETIFAACLAGLLLGLAAAAATRSWSMPFGFGPAIAAGALLVLLSPVHFLAMA